MKINKNYLIGTGIVILVIVTVIIINNNVHKCLNEDSLFEEMINDKFYCYRNITSNELCNIDELYSDKGYCLYKSKEIINNKYFVWGFFSLIVLLFGVLIYNMINNKPQTIKKVSPIKAVELIKCAWAKRHRITNYGYDKYHQEYIFPKDTFKIFGKYETFIVSTGEEFLQFNMEIFGGSLDTEVVTFLTSLSKGENYILDWGFRFSEEVFDDYFVASRRRPLYIPTDKTEPMIDTLAQTKPEIAMKLREQQQQKLIESSVFPEEEIEYRVPIKPKKRGKNMKLYNSLFLFFVSL